MQCAVRDMWCLNARPGNPEVGAAEEMLRKLLSSRAESNWQLRATVGQNSSSVQSAAAGYGGQNSSAHVVRSRAAIWTLIRFK